MNWNNINLKQKIRVGFGISFLVLLLSAILSFYSIKELITQSEWVNHTNAVIIGLENLFSTIRDSEAHQRGYLLTKQEYYLENYKGSFESSIKSINELRELTRDNMQQQVNLDSLEDLVKKRYTRLDAIIDLYKLNNYNIHPDSLMKGRIVMENIKQVITRMNKEENKLFLRRKSEAQKYSNSSPTIILLSSLFAVTLSLLSFFFIDRDIQTREIIQNDLDDKNYHLTGIDLLNSLLRGENNMERAGSKILQHLCNYTNSRAGLIYLINEEGVYHLTGNYSVTLTHDLISKFNSGEGILGLAAKDKNVLTIENIAPHQINIKSGLVTSQPLHLIIVPFHSGEETVAVVELLSEKKLSEREIQYLQNLSGIVTVLLNNIAAEQKTLELLSETQSQAEELEAQQEEMRQLNDELREQRDRLQASEEELRASEEELQEKNAELEIQYQTLKEKNQVLEEARQAIQLKIQQVETVSKYKTDFLSNMSHELRTPLNSILILSSLLKENKNKRLTEKEVEQAAVIERSGQDLLKLINEILDLSKIESGKIQLEITEFSPSELNLQREFEEIAKERNIEFILNIQPDFPAKIATDRFRVQQILRNLLSNAFKFTPASGTVTLEIGLSQDNEAQFKVIDTGIGIDDDKKLIIFEAFQQADPSTTRKFGGTGLGLTISRDLAKLLGGEISLTSQKGKGSTFTLTLPLSFHKEKAPTVPTLKSDDRLPADVSEKVAAIHTTGEGSNKILIVEDDFYFANILKDFARQRGYETIITASGKEAIQLASEHVPSAILLDVQLPDLNGLSVLKQIKAHPILKKIPVHIMSAYDVQGQENFLPKPLSVQQLEKAFNEIAKLSALKEVLIVEDNVNENNAVKELLESQSISSTQVFNGNDALKIIAQRSFDCIILDIKLPDIQGMDILKSVRNNPSAQKTPVIIYSGKDLSLKEEVEFKKYTDVIIIKTDLSYTRLMDEVKLFLYKVNQKIESESTSTPLILNDTILQNKTILLADDDIRNIFSLTSFLEDHQVNVIAAYNGKQAVSELESNKVDLILMDVMMPEMDGIEATRMIRSKAKYKDLPIIAVTAKAMPEDRENCFAAGVSDYISKPIDLQKLLSLIRVWIYKS